MKNIVAVVGRPNVGKSTFFNRMIGMRQAIVDEFSGVTRDRHYGHVEWQNKEFTLIDTGGYIEGSDDVFEGEIASQVVLAIEEADVILFMADAAEGITGFDDVVADLLRRSGKPVLTIANKCDNSDRISLAAQFYSFGLGEVYPVSSANGSGTGELLDALVEALPQEIEYEEEEDLPKITVVGRPNAGKSSLINTLLGTERNIVTPVAGTTRDSINTRFQGFGFDFYLVDTAGIRKKSKVHEDLEFYSVMRSIRAIEHADVGILMVDATAGFTSQDTNIFGLLQKNNKGVVIVVNKWDLIEGKDTKSVEVFKKDILKKVAPFTDVEVVFTSVTEKQRVLKALEAAIRVHENRSRKIKTGKLNDLLLPIIADTPPPSYKGKYIKIKYITQLPIAYPAFVFFANLPQYVKEPYKRFIENQLRKNFDFKGVPIEIFMRKK